MRITLNKQEYALVRQYGNEFKDKTGQVYSTYYIMTLLTQRYSDSLDDDLKKVMNQKELEQKEKLAEQNHTTGD